ncbi:MAG: hypothetical protein WBA39_17380 [Rivularia sp. (in: cyanobacteria)]
MQRGFFIYINAPLFKTLEINFAETGIIEVSINQIAIFKSGLEDIGLIPNPIPKVTANENTSANIIDPSHIGTIQVKVFPFPKVPDSVSQVSSSQNSTTEVNVKGATLQINIAKINTSEQTFTQFTNDDSAKISPSGSIMLQQFLSSHNLLLQFINKFKDNSSTPFNLIPPNN